MTDWVFKYCINGGVNYQHVGEKFCLTYEQLAEKEKSFSKYLERIKAKYLMGFNTNGRKNYIVDLSISETPKQKNVLIIKYEKSSKFKVFLKTSYPQDTEHYKCSNDFCELNEKKIKIPVPSYFELRIKSVYVDSLKFELNVKFGFQKAKDSDLKERQFDFIRKPQGYNLDDIIKDSDIKKYENVKTFTENQNSFNQKFTKVPNKFDLENLIDEGFNNSSICNSGNQKKSNNTSGVKSNYENETRQLAFKKKKHNDSNERSLEKIANFNLEKECIIDSNESFNNKKKGKRLSNLKKEQDQQYLSGSSINISDLNKPYNPENAIKRQIMFSKNDNDDEEEEVVIKPTRKAKNIFDQNEDFSSNYDRVDNQTFGGMNSSSIPDESTFFKQQDFYLDQNETDQSYKSNQKNFDSGNKSLIVIEEDVILENDSNQNSQFYEKIYRTNECKRKSEKESLKKDQVVSSNQNLRKRLKKLVNEKRELKAGCTQMVENDNSRRQSFDNIKKQTTDDIKRECCICYGDEIDIAGLLECKHNFCFECIFDWSKVTNLCPLCKVAFDKIKKYNKAGLLIDTIKVEERKINEEEIQDFDYDISNANDYCYACDGRGDTDRMLVCDFCITKCCHIFCLNPALEDIPVDDWYCDYCVRDHNINSENPTVGIFEPNRRRFNQPQNNNPRGRRDNRLIIDEEEQEEEEEESEPPSNNYNQQRPARVNANRLNPIVTRPRNNQINPPQANQRNTNNNNQRGRINLRSDNQPQVNRRNQNRNQDRNNHNSHQSFINNLENRYVNMTRSRRNNNPVNSSQTWIDDDEEEDSTLGGFIDDGEISGDDEEYEEEVPMNINNNYRSESERYFGQSSKDKDDLQDSDAIVDDEAEEDNSMIDEEDYSEDLDVTHDYDIYDPNSNQRRRLRKNQDNKEPSFKKPTNNASNNKKWDEMIMTAKERSIEKRRNNQSVINNEEKVNFGRRNGNDDLDQIVNNKMDEEFNDDDDFYNVNYNQRKSQEYIQNNSMSNNSNQFSHYQHGSPNKRNLANKSDRENNMLNVCKNNYNPQNGSQSILRLDKPNNNIGQAHEKLDKNNNCNDPLHDNLDSFEQYIENDFKEYLNSEDKRFDHQSNNNTNNKRNQTNNNIVNNTNVVINNYNINVSNKSGSNNNQDNEFSDEFKTHKVNTQPKINNDNSSKQNAGINNNLLGNQVMPNDPNLQGNGSQNHITSDLRVENGRVIERPRTQNKFQYTTNHLYRK